MFYSLVTKNVILILYNLEHDITTTEKIREFNWVFVKHGCSVKSVV